MYAEIAVNVPVQGTFYYHIPPELAGKLKPGHLVRVSFGVAEQPGIVLALRGETPCKVSGTHVFSRTLSPRIKWNFWRPIFPAPARYVSD